MSRPARVLLGAVGFYRRAISPLLGPRCRFVPTCSEYAQDALAVHGARRGSWLTVVRIAKCAPWHPGGVDLVPSPRGAGPVDPGTAQHAHSWDTGAGPVPAGRSIRVPRSRTRSSALPPDPTLQQEAGVA